MSKINYITEIKTGNTGALIDLYKLYRNEFIIWAYKNYKCDDENAKDIFQDVIIAFYENVKSNKLQVLTSDIKTYLFSIGKFKVINFQKKNSRTVTFDPDELIKLYNQPDQSMSEKEAEEYSKDTIKKYISELNEDCQKVLNMYYFEELDMKTIAQKMGYKNADVAKKKKYECFKKLAEMVKKGTMMLIF